MNEPQPLPKPESSDHSLLVRVKSGESEAATALYLRYAEHLRALAIRQSSQQLASRVDPEDLVQSIFRTFFRRVARDQYDVPNGEDLWKLLLVIALHKIRNAANYHTAAKRDVRATVPVDALATGAESLGQQNSDIGMLVLQSVIDDVLQELPEVTREIVALRIEGYELNEIVARCGRSKRSVERILQQFRQKLKVKLDEDSTPS